MMTLKLSKSIAIGLLSIVMLLHLISDDLYAQSLTGQNEIRYGRPGKKEFNSYDYLYYMENYLQLYATYEEFTLHVRQRYLMPSEFGERRDGLDAFDKIFVEYKTDHLRVKGGDFYTEWGRGLLMGSLESLELNFDSGLEGIMAEADYNNVEIAVFRGIEVDTSSAILESAAGGMLSYNFPYSRFIAGNVKLGGSAIHFDEGNRHAAFDRRGVEAQYLYDFGSVYVSYSTDSYNELAETYFHGYYSAFEFFGRDWSLLIDYKNYRFPPFQLPALQFPPQAFPTSIMYLFSREQPETHYQNDVGVQAELTYRFNGWDYNLNVNQSSYQDKIRILPSRQTRLHPFWSTFGTAEYAPLGKDRLLFQAGYMETTARNYRYGGGILYEWRIDSELTLTSEAQSVWVETPSTWSEEEESYLWAGYREDYILIALTKSHFGTITGTLARSNYEWATEGTFPKGRLKHKIFGRGQYWPAILLTADFMERHQLRLFYGYERGGLGCAGGLCRLIQPFRGVKATFTSQF
jgi:hypothetical protein